MRYYRKYVLGHQMVRGNVNTKVSVTVNCVYIT